MPLIFRILGYGGNGILFALGLIAATANDAFWPGLFMVALGGLNLYIIRKIDIYSREESWLETELHKRELRYQIAELDRQAGAETHAAEPKRIAPQGGIEPPQS